MKMLRNIAAGIILFIMLPNYAGAQDTLITYFDKNWKETSENNKVYYRKAYKINKKWHVLDYYKNGQVQMEGDYLTKALKTQIGNAIYYSSSGKISSVGKYKNGKKHGAWKDYTADGKLDGHGKFKLGKEKGWWNWYYKNGQKSAKEYYKNGEMKKGLFWKENGEKMKAPLKKMIMPKFPGGEQALLNYLSSNISYPRKARIYNWEGRVIIDFIVNEKGVVTRPKVVKSVRPVLDEEALRVIRTMPNWSPAKSHNRTVKVAYTLPINFSLGDNN